MPVKKKGRKAVRKATPAKKKDKAPELAARRDPGLVDNKSKSLFLNTHLPEIAKLKDRAKSAQSYLRNAYKSAKKDGFLQRDFDVAFRLKTQLGERQLKSEIARDMTIAKWLGFGLGKQLDLFVEAETRDIEGQAHSEGEEASRNNEAANPVYAPGTPGYEAYMAGFHEHQEETVKGGIQKVDYQPSSGTPMTRSQFRAQQMLKKADAAEERSMFTKRAPDVA